MKDFRSLRVWQRSHDLVLGVYRATKQFPSDEAFGLRAQLRRSATSVPANIAEGCGRGTDRDFGRFVQIALGSASETEYHLLLARDLGYIEAVSHDELSSGVQEVKRNAEWSDVPVDRKDAFWDSRDRFIECFES